jgi:hypothetical protein
VVAGTATVIELQGISTPSQTTIDTAGYTITFSSMQAGEGVVQNSVPNLAAVPVAGASGGSPEYLTGNYGSALTSSIGSSGNYLSTGGGTITITFKTAQTAFALLWGSIDGTGTNMNRVTVENGSTVVGTVTGADAASALGNGFEPNGGQGTGGSGYITINSGTAFTTLVFTSMQPSFEFTGIVGSTDPIGTPEPMSLAMLGTGLLGLGAVLRRRA